MYNYEIFSNHRELVNFLNENKIEKSNIINIDINGDKITLVYYNGTKQKK